MTEQQVRDLIEQFIIANGVNAITADVLRPILLAILGQTNDYIGDLDLLQTADQTDLVTAINEVISYLSNINNDGVKLYQGVDSPLITPPPSFNIADFYYENLAQILWQFNGVEWIKIVGNSQGVNVPYKARFDYSGSNTFNLPTNVIALDVRYNGEGDNINWSQLGNSINYGGVMDSGDFLVVIGVYSNVQFSDFTNYFIKKSDFQTVENTQSGTDVIVSLPLNGASYINFTNPLLESISGVSFLTLVGEIGEPPYPGKPFIFKNLTGNDITIKNNQTVLFFERAFLTKDGQDVVIPNGEHIRFNYGVKLEDSFRSWGSGVLETKNKLITIPLGDLGVAIEDVTYEMVSDYITNLGIVVEKGENYYFEVIEVPLTYNFDLTSPNWASKGVTDEASFNNWLATVSPLAPLTNIVVTDFNFEGDRIFCNMTADGTEYRLIGLELVNADKIGVVNGLTILYLSSNQIEEFSPTIPLPSSLVILFLSDNKMTLAGYTASEVWANAQPAFTNPCNVYFGGNIDSITGTNLEAILLTKNCVIHG